jgi:hypothetical protein
MEEMEQMEQILELDRRKSAKRRDEVFVVISEEGRRELKARESSTRAFRTRE